MKETILEMIIRFTGYEELRDNCDIDLVEEDILDSLAFIELIAELEDTFDIEIQPTRIPKDSWNTVDNIVKLVESLQNRD